MRNQPGKAACYTVFIILCVIYGAFLALFVIDRIGRFGVLQSIVSLLILLASLFLSVILHEFGHLVCGLITGYKFLSFRIFSLLLYKEEGKLKFKVSPSSGGVLGQCLMGYKKEYSSDMPYFLYNAGGVIMNLVIFFLATILSFFVHTQMGLITLTIIGFLNLMFALTNAVPYIAPFNDGRNIFLLKDEECRKALFDQLKMNEEFAKGRSYADIEFLDYKYTNADTITLTVYIASMYKNFITGRFEEANGIKINLYNNLVYFGKAFESALLMEIAYCDIVFNANFTAVELYSRIPPQQAKAYILSKDASAAFYGLMYLVFFKKDFSYARQRIPYVKMLAEKKVYFAEREKLYKDIAFIESYIDSYESPFPFN